MNPDGSADKNILSLYETSNGARLNYDVIDGTGGTAALKITSKCTNLVVTVDHLIGGSENCVDLNNECKDVEINCDALEVRGKYALSAKTCRNVTFRGHVEGVPSQWAVNLGSWSDQSKKVQDTTKLVLTADVYPIVVWIGNAVNTIYDDPSKYKVIGFGRFGWPVRPVVMFFWSILKALHLA
jgi:hypothetical protein